LSPTAVDFLIHVAGLAECLFKQKFSIRRIKAEKMIW